MKRLRFVSKEEILKCNTSEEVEQCYESRTLFWILIAMVTFFTMLILFIINIVMWNGLALLRCVILSTILVIVDTELTKMFEKEKREALTMFPEEKSKINMRPVGGENTNP